MPSLIKVQSEFKAIDDSLDEAGAPPATSRALRIRELHRFYQRFYEPLDNKEVITPEAKEAEFNDA